MSTSKDIQHPLARVLGRKITFHRALVDLSGSVCAALLLSQAIYWQQRVPNDGDLAHREGWWWKTREEWKAETGLSRSEQEGARRLLRKQPWFRERLRGVPGRMHFQVDIDLLLTQLATQPTSRQEASHLDDENSANNLAANQPTSRQEAGHHSYAEITPDITPESTAPGRRFSAAREAEERAKKATAGGRKENVPLTDEFELAWALYPARAGGNPKLRAFKAWSARRREGVTAEEMISGTTRYADYCRQMEKLNTEYVLQAATFWGPDRRYAETWAIPEVRFRTGGNYGNTHCGSGRQSLAERATEARKQFERNEHSKTNS